MSDDDPSVIVRKRIREIFGLNQAKGYGPKNPTELAKKMKLSPQAVNALLNSDKSLTLKSVGKVARALDCAPAELLSIGTSEDESLDREPTAREMARFVRWAKRTPDAEQFLEGLLIANDLLALAKRSRD